MALRSPRMKWPFPEQGQDPWFDAFQSMVNALDASGYASREDRQIFIGQGGTLCWNAQTSVLNWSAPIVLFAPITGFQWQIPAGTAIIQDGQLAYVNLVRAPASNLNLNLVVANQVPSSDVAMLICIRAGDRLYFRDGHILLNGHCDPILSEPRDVAHVVPQPQQVDGNLETIVGSVYLRGTLITEGHAMLGSVAPGDSASLRVRRNADSTSVAVFGGVPGLLADRTITNIQFIAGWHDLLMFSSNANGTAVCTGVNIQTR